MHHHHDAEEKGFFPSIELISGVQGIMERNIEQHRIFTPGFDQFQDYARNCLAKDYDGQKIRSLIDVFAEALTQHLHDEVETLRALDVYDSERIRHAYRRFEKSLMATDNVRFYFGFQTMSCNVADSVSVSNRPARVWNRRQELRRRHAQFSVCTILCALRHSLLVCSATSWRMAIQSVHYLERSQRVSLQRVNARP